jgi:hypothetical protein
MSQLTSSNHNLKIQAAFVIRGTYVLRILLQRSKQNAVAIKASKLSVQKMSAIAPKMLVKLTPVMFSQWTTKKFTWWERGLGVIHL